MHSSEKNINLHKIMKTGRIMAFDYGLKRTGIAVSDLSQVLSFPLETVSTEKLIEWLENYIKNEKVSQFVIGLPVYNKNITGIESHIKGFIKRLKKKFPDIPTDRYDERFTSKIAREAIISSNIPKMKRRNKALTDKISASIILQSYISYFHRTE